MKESRKRQSKTKERIKSEKMHRMNRHEHHEHQALKRHNKKQRRYSTRNEHEDFDE